MRVQRDNPDEAVIAVLDGLVGGVSFRQEHCIVKVERLSDQARQLEQVTLRQREFVEQRADHRLDRYRRPPDRLRRDL